MDDTVKIIYTNPRKGVFVLCTYLAKLAYLIDSNTPMGYNCDMKQDSKKQASRRLKIIEGQVRGLLRMVEEEKYCIDIINQSLAIKQALSGVEDVVLENHLSTHVTEQVKRGREDKAIKEILAVYKAQRKR